MSLRQTHTEPADIPRTLQISSTSISFSSLLSSRSSSNSTLSSTPSWPYLFPPSQHPGWDWYQKHQKSHTYQSHWFSHFPAVRRTLSDFSPRPRCTSGWRLPSRPGNHEATGGWCRLGWSTLSSGVSRGCVRVAFRRRSTVLLTGRCLTFWWPVRILWNGERWAEAGGEEDRKWRDRIGMVLVPWPSSLKVSSRFSLSFSFFPRRLFLPPYLGKMDQFRLRPPVNVEIRQVKVQVNCCRRWGSRVQMTWVARTFPLFLGILKFDDAGNELYFQSSSERGKYFMRWSHWGTCNN